METEKLFFRSACLSPHNHRRKALFFEFLHAPRGAFPGFSCEKEATWSFTRVRRFSESFSRVKNKIRVMVDWSIPPLWAVNNVASVWPDPLSDIAHQLGNKFCEKKGSHGSFSSLRLKGLRHKPFDYKSINSNQDLVQILLHFEVINPCGGFNALNFSPHDIEHSAQHKY